MVGALKQNIDAPIDCDLKLWQTDQPTDRPTNRQTDMRALQLILTKDNIIKSYTSKSMKATYWKLGTQIRNSGGYWFVKCQIFSAKHVCKIIQNFKFIKNNVKCPWQMRRMLKVWWPRVWACNHNFRPKKYHVRTNRRTKWFVDVATLLRRLYLITTSLCCKLQP